MKKKHLVPAFAIGIPFGLILGALYSMDAPVVGMDAPTPTPLSSAVIVGIIGAIASTLGIALYAVWREQRWNAWAQQVCAPYDAEGIERLCYALAGDGNALALFALLTVGRLGMKLDAGGLLVLTTKRLLFVRKGYHRAHTQLDLPVSDILGVGPGVGFARNVIRIGTRAKAVLQFKVDDRDAWIDALPGTKLGTRDTARR